MGRHIRHISHTLADYLGQSQTYQVAVVVPFTTYPREKHVTPSPAGTPCQGHPTTVRDEEKIAWEVE